MRIIAAAVAIAVVASSAALGIPEKYRATVEPSVQEYAIPQDLSGVRHLNKAEDLTAEQKKALASHGFVVAPDETAQMFYLYEEYAYPNGPIPNFITVDSVLQAYHILFDFALRRAEEDSLAGLCEHLTHLGCGVSVGYLKKAPAGVLREAAARNVAYFLVARALLTGREPAISANVPDKAHILQLARQELSKISALAGRSESPLMERTVHYDQFRPRGHYTRSEKLSKYFQAMMWYGRLGFELDQPVDDPTMVRRHTLQALLITRMMHDIEWARSLWDRIYEPTVFFVGTADDLTWLDYVPLAQTVYGDELSLEAFADTEKLDEFISIARRTLPRPEIAPAFLQADAAGEYENRLKPPPQGRQFRFMGQRFIPDSYMLQQLVWPKVGTDARPRYWPMGLDVMAVLGSRRARQILFEVYREDRFDNYASQIVKLGEEFGSISEEEWWQNLYWGWLHSLQPLLAEKGEGYPTFMRNSAWLDKELVTSLGSWAQLRHDTILYGKPSGAELGNGRPELVHGYVEPYPHVYGRLAWLAEKMRTTLAAGDLLTENIEKAAGKYTDMLLFLKMCAEKQLDNIPLTEKQYDRIQKFGGELERVSLSVVEDGEYLRGWWEIRNEADRYIATIADIHTSFGNCLEVGVGWAYRIYVIVPHPSSGLQLAKGGVMTYHEFKWPVSDRLTDEKWIEMLKAGEAPPMPEWTRSFVVP